MTKTIGEQVVDDLKAAVEVTDELLGCTPKTQMRLLDENYQDLLVIVLDHIHYVMDKVGYLEEITKMTQEGVI